ncbi:hypothetical protein M2451_004091 [Dysgonomonas sp. PFB1-18]|uniref:hypothetical protein n=1 Tax=unclassified Dysgonomonas TaxID=2630389 RepID=UPI002474020A|nr:MULTISPECIES: hypothetical protein [unclassified Dysgonomonas]MDH6311171.1 hypothetical protein [Dysgonomonas sp. PF1-14]MDH6341045.1 hypothetical protein [Dysgonomonas sp. PF1-16]MDH6382742.1 hypothetical protein [Dysgonomonas sp. PFB1-18]MDH6400043.1 hypothetical protein [Dysgonomonas sp. PF1-23]
MFGFKKKKVSMKDLLNLIDRQNDVIKELLSLYSSLASKIPENAKQYTPDTTILLDKICGKWHSQKLDICIIIKKEKYSDNYYVEISDLERLPEDFIVTYPIELYKDMMYFVLDGHVIFMEYEADSHELSICGKLSLLRTVTDAPLYPGIPLDL